LPLSRCVAERAGRRRRRSELRSQAATYSARRPRPRPRPRAHGTARSLSGQRPRLTARQPRPQQQQQLERAARGMWLARLPRDTAPTTTAPRAPPPARRQSARALRAARYRLSPIIPATLPGPRLVCYCSYDATSLVHEYFPASAGPAPHKKRTRRNKWLVAAAVAPCTRSDTTRPDRARVRPRPARASPSSLPVASSTVQFVGCTPSAYFDRRRRIFPSGSVTPAVRSGVRVRRPKAGRPVFPTKS
jgi:hypothetical protein